MRSSLLFNLFMPLNGLPGIGVAIAKKLTKLLGGEAAIDLLFHRPRGLLIRQKMDNIRQLKIGMHAVLPLEIIDIQAPQGNTRTKQIARPYRIIAHDDNGDAISLIYFHADINYLKRLFPVGQKLMVAGKIEAYEHYLQMPHPDYVEPLANADKIPLIEPLYPLTAGISNKMMMRYMRHLLDKCLPDLPEWLDEQWFSTAQGWPSFTQALIATHQPSLTPSQEKGGEDAHDPYLSYLRSKALMRLAYDELLANQLALGFVRRRITKEKGRIYKSQGNYEAGLRQALPFNLTQSQDQVIKEIKQDLEQETRMLRLLQGDVGSGKTLVALFAMLHVLDSGQHQACLLVPTEILARQHYETIKNWVKPLGLQVSLLTGQGKQNAKARKANIEAIAKGECHIIIGTHALFQAEVTYKDLGLIIIDEQHRFGVHQRLNLSDKGKMADILVMTATPIPRTLMMSVYGDLDHSSLTEKPAGRKPITTVVMQQDRLDALVERLFLRLQAGDQAYWICPLVEDSEVSDMVSAEFRAKSLQSMMEAQYGQEKATRIGLVHGRMKAQEKENIMQDFHDHKLDLLVATTVIEVGVDVANACIMVIEHAEQFGLAQLHQLRGRVGRGDKESSCVLLRRNHIGDIAYQRLKLMSETQDGLLIAEKDMQLRGAGEVLGVKQSGLPEFYFADFALHKDMLSHAHREARELLENDPNLQSERGQAIRHLLYLFRYDQSMNLLISG